MRTRTRRWWSWPAVGALAVVLGAPALAHAQQGGLFPLAPIKRERVPCAAEDPVYKMYRQEYFGYHPTCWRRFPTGWGCPSPEAPNAEKAFKELPRDKPPAELTNGEESAPDTGPGGPAAGGRPGAGGAAAPAGPGAPGTRQPNNLPPVPDVGPSPFELGPKPATPPATTPPGGTARAPQRASSSRSALASAATPSGGNAPPDMPESELAMPPVVNPPASAHRTEAAPPAAAATDTPGAQPLLALPDPTVGPSSSASSNAQPLPDLAPPSGNDAASAPAPTPAPRTSLLSRIFGGGLFRR